MPDDFKKDLYIDPHDLKDGWLNQPILLADWSEKYADAAFLRDKAKQNLDVVRANLDKEIRTNWENYFEKNPTETALSVAISGHKDMVEAHNEYLEASRKANLLMGAVQAFNNRKKALEYLTQLYLSNYYADPKIPSEAKEIEHRASSKKQKDGLGRSSRLQKRRKKDGEKEKS